MPCTEDYSTNLRVSTKHPKKNDLFLYQCYGITRSDQYLHSYGGFTRDNPTMTVSNPVIHEAGGQVDYWITQVIQMSTVGGFTQPAASLGAKGSVKPPTVRVWIM